MTSNTYKYNCLIVEDEPFSQEIITDYIANCPELNLVKICNNAMEANSTLLEHHIDLIFLDINMPQINGIDWWKSLHQAPQVILTTAYPEYAVDGFNLNAIDYLLKPFSFERFLQAVNKFLKTKKQLDTNSSSTIMVKSDKKIYPVKYTDITYLEANGDYVKINRANDYLLLHDTLKNFHQQLPQNQFIRVHRSFVINISKIDFIEGNRVAIGENRIPITESYREDLKEAIQLFN